jgi:hypothetical protein
MQYRTENILQYRDSSCQNEEPGEDAMQLFDRLRPNAESTAEYETLFKKDINPVNCRNTFDGTFSFFYQVRFEMRQLNTETQNAIQYHVHDFHYKYE